MTYTIFCRVVIVPKIKRGENFMGKICTSKHFLMYGNQCDDPGCVVYCACLIFLQLLPYVSERTPEMKCQPITAQDILDFTS